MMKLALTATAATLALGGAAWSQTMPYVTLGGTYLTDSEIGAATARAGVDIGQYLGVEAEGSIGVVDGDLGAADVELDHMIAGFGRARMPISENFEGFVRGGYYFAEASVDTPAIDVELDDDDFAAGAGVQWNFGERSALRADYTNFGFTDDGHSGALSYVLKF